MSTDTDFTAHDVDDALDQILDGPEPDVDDAQSAEPYVQAIRADDLFADPTYQRDLDENRVDRMVTSFKISLVGILEVSQRADGRYAILDGQHRWATCRNRAFGTRGENPHLVCRVHVGLTVEDEARLYHELNTTRKQLTGWDRWVSRRASGDKTVRDIEACLTERGLVVGPGIGDNVMRATRTCELVVELGGLTLLGESVEVIRAAYPGDQDGLDGCLVHGVAHVLNAYDRDELDVARLVTALAGVLPRQMSARASAAHETHKGTKDRLAGHAIVERYNAMKGPRLEPFFARVKPVSKTKTLATQAADAYRERVLAWAVASDYEGRQNRMGPKLRAAYAAANPDDAYAQAQVAEQVGA